MFLIGADRYITIDLVLGVEPGPNPLFEGFNFQLSCTPTSVGGRQKVSVLLQPEVEASVGVKALDWLTQETF